MCGIAGLLGVPGTSIDGADLDRLAEALVHRGPDQQGTFARGNVGLSATRLAIVDLSDAGSQPMADGGFALAFNGEIYNHGDLRRELEADGVRLEGHADTEVLFHHLRMHGVAATLPRLQGMFAFAWHDGERLWLARDRFGIKPLAWTRQAGMLAFASEAQALARVADLRVDPIQALFGFLSLSDRSGRRTAFRGVEQVPPGHVLSADGSGPPTVEAWHDLAADVDADLAGELADLPRGELALRLDHLLADAVQRMLQGDAPTGSFVSGGVDSALLAVLVDPHRDHALLTADVVGPQSEVSAARAVAASVGRPLLTAPFTADDVLDQWAPATLTYEAPLVTHMNSLPYGNVARLAHAHGIKSVLTGEGADELFFGYSETAFEPARRLLRAPVEAIVHVYGRVPGLAKRVVPELWDARERHLADAAEDYEQRRRNQAALDAYDFAGRHGPRLAAGLQMLGGHLLSLLHRNDRIGMAASVESRFPYLDEEVVRFALALPLEARLRWSSRPHDRKHPFLEDKAVLRDVAERHLDSEIARRPKDGFPTLGHEQLDVDPAFFADGWLAEALGWSAAGIEHLADEPRVVSGRLASVEVFARLFDRGETPEQVTDHIRDHVRVAG